MTYDLTAYIYPKPQTSLKNRLMLYSAEKLEEYTERSRKQAWKERQAHRALKTLPTFCVVSGVW